ncbi:dihydrodipicolinate synthase family protein [Dactylosporangium sp. NPDC005555]|uniref:dihydrodipicolinate synthase family protein n=1 Tax=Dactylosporangium sp. NPDC005555 TaxID=3154889 RepID=UPI0033BAD951
MTQEPVTLWRGVAVALVTLFAEDGSVDVAATAEHAERLVASGVRAVLVAGSTGEADALSDGERVALVAAVRRACPGVPVIAGAGGAWAGPAAELTAATVAVGADAVLVAPPRRSGDLRVFYERVVSAADGRPVLAYHFPGVAGGAVPLEVLPSLPVAGLKDSTGDPERLLRLLVEWDGAVYVGSSALVSAAGMLGAAGAILAVANVAAEDCVAAWEGDAAAQLRLVAPHVAARSAFPHGLKRLVAARFGTSTAARMG